MKLYRFYSKEVGVIIETRAESVEEAFQHMRNGNYFEDFPDLRFVSEIPEKE